MRRGMCYTHYWQTREENNELDTCSQDDCKNHATRRGLCGKHYKQWLKLNTRACSIKDCEKPAVGRSYCMAHYNKWSKYGDPLASAPRKNCIWGGCNKEVVISRSGTGLCAYHQKRQWRKDHPESDGSFNAARRARKRNQFKEFVDRTVLFKRDGGLCGICELAVDPGNWHLDHIIPLAQGGEHSYANTQVSHPACNLKKGTKILQGVA